MNDFILLTLSHHVPEISAFLAAFPFAWMAYRSRSLFVLRYRLWRLTQPRGDIQDELIREAVQTRADLISFRSVLVWADTPGDAHRLAEFAKSRRLDVGSLGDCGPYFDRDALRVKDKVPSLKSTKVFTGIAFYVIGALLVLLLMGASQERALAAFKDGGSWFWLGHDNARLFLGNHNRSFMQTDCGQTGGVAGFTADQSKQLCSIFADPLLPQEIAAGVMSQRWAALIGSCVLLMLLVITLNLLHAVRSAHAVRAWLARVESQPEGVGPKTAT